MAFEIKLRSKGGPRLWTLLGAWYEGKPPAVTFDLIDHELIYESWVHEHDSLTVSDSSVRVKVLTLHRKHKGSGGAEQGLVEVTGELLHPASDAHDVLVGLVVHVIYDSHARSGNLTITERDYEAGDLLFEWMDNAKTRAARAHESKLFYFRKRDRH
jgi:hypothetical protein